MKLINTLNDIKYLCFLIAIRIVLIPFLLFIIIFQNIIKLKGNINEKTTYLKKKKSEKNN